MFVACESGDAPLVGATGEPRVHEEYPWVLDTPEGYLETARGLRERDGFVGLDPGAHQEFTRWGILPRGMRAYFSVAVRAVEGGGFEMRTDLDDDGRLDDAEPVRFREEVEHAEGRRLVSGRELDVSMRHQNLSIEGRLALDLLVTSDGSPQYVLETMTRRREGKLRISGRSLAFAIDTPRRVHQYAEVCFDLDEDGQMQDLECFDHGLRRVELLGQKYRIEVGANADWLALTPIDAEIVTPISGTTGEVVPDFAFEDSSGEAGRLSDYRGHVVLLDFWATWCSPCVADTPKLLELHGRFADDGLTILAVSVEDEPQALDAYVREHGLPWRQIGAGFEDPIPTLFHVRSYPTYVVIDQEGRFLARPSREALVETVAAVFRGP